MLKILCGCGCGTEIEPYDEYGRKRTYVNYHGRRGKTQKSKRGEDHHNWKGGKMVHGDGYVLIKQPDHPRANKRGYVCEHILVLEKSFGRRILKTEAVHHIDGNRKNNVPGNLMVFKTRSMHDAYERRLKAFNACGHYDWRQCCYCHNWDDINNMVKHGNRGLCHKICRTSYKPPTHRIFTDEELRDIL